MRLSGLLLARLSFGFSVIQRPSESLSVRLSFGISVMSLESNLKPEEFWKQIVCQHFDVASRHDLLVG